MIDIHDININELLNMPYITNIDIVIKASKLTKYFISNNILSIDDIEKIYKYIINKSTYNIHYNEIINKYELTPILILYIFDLYKKLDSKGKLLMKDIIDNKLSISNICNILSNKNINEDKDKYLQILNKYNITSIEDLKFILDYMMQEDTAFTINNNGNLLNKFRIIGYNLDL